MAGLLPLTFAPDGVSAATRGAVALRHAVSYCVESAPPGVAIAQARTLLTQAIGEWHLPAGLTSGQALSLTQHNPCQSGTQVRVRAANLGSGGPAATATATAITFNTTVSWWDGLGARDSWEYSYRGVLTHEMGHTFGIGHAGGTKWSFDANSGSYPTNQIPTMTQSGDQTTSVHMETVQKDDKGMAAYVRGGTPRFWSANPGFEDDFDTWGRSAASVGPSYAYSGARGVRLAGYSYVFSTALYDPYRGGGYGVVAPNMSTSAVLGGRAHGRNPACCATRGFRQKYQYSYLQYNTSVAKADTHATFTTWSSIINLGGCAASSPSGPSGWFYCSGTVSLPNSPTNTATAFSLYTWPWTNSGDNAVHIDEVGIYGGMTS